MKPLSFLIISLFIISATASAQVVPDKMIFSFDPKGLPVVNVDLTNTSEDRSLYIETESQRVINPGDENEILKKEGALIVSPKSFSLTPGGKRTVRLLLKNKALEKEDVYRVSFVPKSFVDSPEAQLAQKKEGIRLTVLLGSGVLVFAPPAEPIAKLSWKRSGTTYQLINTGNVNLLVDVTKRCSSEGTNCEEIAVGKRIYPGETLNVEAKNLPYLHCRRETPAGDITNFEIKESEGEKIFSGI